MVGDFLFWSVGLLQTDIYWISKPIWWKLNGPFCSEIWNIKNLKNPDNYISTVIFPPEFCLPNMCEVNVYILSNFHRWPLTWTGCPLRLEKLGNRAFWKKGLEKLEKLENHIVLKVKGWKSWIFVKKTIFLW